MSWIRSAMNKAAEVPGGAIFRAAVRTYTDTVFHHAGYSVSGVATAFHDRIAAQNMQSFSDAIRRLDEVSVSCKGEERVQLLKSWLFALKDFEKSNRSAAENEGKISEDPHAPNYKNVTSGKAAMILYYDPNHGSVPMNFRDVFLHSQALEGMTMSMILGAPNEEEILLLHEIFGLCLTGGREVHDVVLKNIQDLAKVFSIYDSEMLVRREELLQFAQTAITGLKITTDVARIDSEISQIQQSLNRMKCHNFASDGSENSSGAPNSTSSMETEESVAHIQLCCRLKSLLLKKRLLKKGDTPQTHAQKVDKLKVLLESLHHSAYKTEKRMLEHREQKKEILIFCVARTSEVSQIEKDLKAEISVIEKQRDKLEAELRQVNSTLVAAITRLQDAREERLQFDEDNDEFFLDLKEKEDELSKTIVSYRAEADACNAFINFLESTWDFQSSFVNQRDKQVNDQLQNHEAYIINVVASFLSTYKDQLEPAIANLRKLLQSLKGYQIIDPDEEFLHDIKQRANIEQEYLDAEAKVVILFNAVESIKQHFYSAIDDASRKDVEVINNLCNAIEKLERDFKINKRPILRIEIPANEDLLSPSTGSPKGVKILSPVRAMPDFKSIFSQNLLTKSPKKTPYIPLGGSSENSLIPTMENDTKSTENKKHKNKVPESEKPSHFDKYVSSPTLKSENKMTLGHDKESREQLQVSESQESKMKEHAPIELDKKSVTSALEKETSINTETTEGREKSEASTGNGAKLLDPSVSTMENDTKSTENKQHKCEAWDSENPSHFGKYVSNPTLKSENKTSDKLPLGHDKESRKQLHVSESQESKMHELATIELDIELVTSALKIETGVNSETIEGGLGEKSKASTGDGAKLLDSPVSNMENDTESTENKQQVTESQESKMHDHATIDLEKELVTSALKKDTGMNTETTEGRSGEKSEASTEHFGAIKKSADPDEKLSKLNSGIEEKDQVSTEDITGWKCDETVKEQRDDNYHHKNYEISPGEGGGFDGK